MKKSVSKLVLIVEQFVLSLISEILFLAAGLAIGGSLGAYFYFPIGDAEGWEGLAVILGTSGLCIGGLVGVLTINRLNDVKINNIYLHTLTVILTLFWLSVYSFFGSVLSLFIVCISTSTFFTLLSNLSFVKLVNKDSDTKQVKTIVDKPVIVIAQFISSLIPEFVFYVIGLVVGSDLYFSIGDVATRESFWLTLGAVGLCLGGLVWILMINGILDVKIKNFIIYIFAIALILWWFGNTEGWEGSGVVFGNTLLCIGGLVGILIINRMLDVKINNIYLYTSTFVLITLWLGLFLLIGSKLPLSVVFIFTSSILTIVSNLPLARRKD